MATDLERLVVQLSADIKGYENALNRAQGSTNRAIRNIQNQFARSNKNLTNQFSLLSRSFAGIFAGGVTLVGAQRLVDTATQMENALKVAGLEGDSLKAVYDKLFASAQRNAAPLESLVQLYGRVAIVQKELNASTDEMLVFTDNVAKALRVAGTDATTASGALLQLSQAMGAGTVRAEEFSSVQENALPVLQAAAEGLLEAGGSVAKLRTLVTDGRVSSEAFFRAFEAGAYILDEKLAGAESTVSQAFIRLRNVLTDTARDMNKGTGATEKLVGILDTLATTISEMDFSPLISGIVDFGTAVVETIGQVEDLARKAGELTGANNFGKWFYGTMEERNAQNRVAGAHAADPKGDRPKPSGGKPLEVNVNRGRITLEDYEAPGKEKKGGGRGRSTRERADEYERLAKRIADSTAATIAETEAQRGLNPLIEDYGYAVEKARAEQELLTAAKEAGKKVTPQLRSEIAALAEQYALATVEAAQLAEAQDDIRDAARDAAEFNKDLLRGIVDGFAEGGKAADIFANALKKVGDRLLDMAFNAAFDSKGGGGFLSSLLGGLGGIFGKREHGGSVTAGKPYIVGEKRPEVFVPSQSGKIVPRVPRDFGSGSNGGVSAPVSIAIDARGADREGLARVEGQIARLKAELPSHIIHNVRKAQSERKLR